MWVVPLLAALAVGPGLAPAGAMPAPPATVHQAADVAAPPIGDSLRRLAAVIGTDTAPVAGPFPTWPDASRDAHARAARALGALIVLSNDWPRETPLPYRQQLAAIADAVARAARRPATRALETLMGPLADDLEIKLGHCRASGGKLGGLLDVRVRTVHGGKEAGNWQVLVLPRIFDGASGAVPTPFPQLSSPTAARLVPGRYLLWARDPVRGRFSERQVLVLGDGRSGLDVDLPVPATVP